MKSFIMEIKDCTHILREHVKRQSQTKLYEPTIDYASWNILFNDAKRWEKLGHFFQGTPQQ